MKKLLLTAGLAALATGAVAQDRQLQLYNWGDYTSPEMIAKFEAETGIDVTITTTTATTPRSPRCRPAATASTSVVPPRASSPSGPSWA
jgi:spermidine/putrescine transport system substrate-binding protein